MCLLSLCHQAAVGSSRARLGVGAYEALELRRRGAAPDVSPVLQQQFSAHPNLLRHHRSLQCVVNSARLGTLPMLPVSAHLPSCRSDLSGIVGCRRTADCAKFTSERPCRGKLTQGPESEFALTASVIRGLLSPTSGTRRAHLILIRQERCAHPAAFCGARRSLAGPLRRCDQLCQVGCCRLIEWETLVLQAVPR